jgi:hypothetical protein
MAGWHRLSLRFGADRTEIAVDGKELARGREPAGPLVSIEFAGASIDPKANSKTPAAEMIAGSIDDLQIVRYAEPPTSLEIDNTQDEARLILGDQLFGEIDRADPIEIRMNVDEKPIVLPWGDVSGLYFRRQDTAGRDISGWLAQVEWMSSPEDRDQDLDHVEGAISGIDDSRLSLSTPYAGDLSIPWERLRRLRILGHGRRLVVDPNSHHLGNEISVTPPLLDPPLPEGGVLKARFNLDRKYVSRRASLVLDVVQVVGETPGIPFSNFIRNGELRTFAAINGQRIDYLNRFVSTRNETSERIRIPIPDGSLREGENLIQIEQTGIASDPNWLDDLGILQIAVEFEEPDLATGASPPDPSPTPGPGTP